MGGHQAANAMYAGGGTGLATLRRDGFASIDAGQDGGLLTTKLVTFDGRHLFVNADTISGELRVEVLDSHGTVVDPYSADNCVPMSIDGTRQMVMWEGSDDLSSLRSTPLRFRFHLTNGSLYSFWMSHERNGASNGFVAAGGPGLKGSMDMVSLP